jgi:23S rRNA (uracil1939-C5)-methyltransferase
MSRTTPERTGPFRPGITEADVESINHEGIGVAHVNGKATFIDGALPGERVRFRVLNRGKTYDTGKALEVLRPSPDRVTPKCAAFGVCGGCSLQHLKSEAQLPAKQKILADNLARIGKVVPESWLPPLTGPHWGYRRRARLGVRLVDKKGGVLIGFREKRRSYIASLASCDVLHPAISQLLPAMRELVASLSRPDRIPQIEASVGDNVTSLVLRHVVPLTENDDAHLAAFGEKHNVQIYRQPGKPDELLPIWPTTPTTLSYRLGEFGVELEFAPTDFVQVNGVLNRAMVSQALNLLDPRPDEKVLDLFCGLGNFTLPLARRAAHVLGIEADGALVSNGRHNAERNQLANVEFCLADLYGAEGPDPWGSARFDKWLLDPPRTGAIEVIKRLVLGNGPGKIVYVSCNPATLARDSEVLVHAKGYRLRTAGVLDMFPQTSHVEAMALFERAD